MELSQKQEAFVEHYLRVWNAAEAARLAGYSEKTARQQGSRLLTIVDIRTAIDARLAELKMSADEVLTRLADIARGDMADFIKDSGEAMLDLNKARSAGRLHLVKKFKSTKRAVGDFIEITQEIELYDKQQALNTLGKHHRLFVERVELDWRAELEAAGLNPDEQFEGLVNEFVGYFGSRTPADGSGGDQGSGAAS